MPGLEFLDTNVLLYAYDSTEQRKQSIALELLDRAVLGHMVISSQVLAEFASACLHKIAHRMAPSEVISSLEVLSAITVVPADLGIVRRAVEAHERYGIHFYDGMIIAAAERAGCSRVCSEDLNSGQQYFGIAVENPFR